LKEKIDVIKIAAFAALLLAVTIFSLPHDKLLHISVSSFLSSVISSTYGEKVGFFLTLTIGISKEVCDIFTPGTPDIGDIFADLFGDFLGISFLNDKKFGVLFIWEF